MRAEKTSYEEAILTVLWLSEEDVIATSGNGSGWSENASEGTWTPER